MHLHVSMSSKNKADAWKGSRNYSHHWCMAMMRERQHDMEARDVYELLEIAFSHRGSPSIHALEMSSKIKVDAWKRNRKEFG